MESKAACPSKGNADFKANALQAAAAALTITQFTNPAAR